MNRPKRRIVIFANVSVIVMIAIVIFGFVSYVNNRRYVHFDLTSIGKFTLSSKTKNILNGLDKPVVITMLFNPDEIFFGQIKDILSEYEYQSNWITVNQIDPIRNRTKVEELAKGLKLDAVELNSIVFQCGERSKHVSQKDVIERKYPFTFIGEEVFTSAILSVSQESQTGIYFVKGHGEREIDDFDMRGFSSIADSLKRDNCKVIPLELLAKKEIPKACEVLVIAGPTKPFSSEEIDILRLYLQNNGKILVMLEPVFPPNEPSGLRPLLEEYGVRLRDDVVIYNKVHMPLFGTQLVTQIYIGAEEYVEHKITEDMSNLTTVFFGACGIETKPSHGDKGDYNKNMDYKLYALAHAPDHAWGEITIKDNIKPEYDPEKDLSGPISLAVAVEQVNPDVKANQESGHGLSEGKERPQGAMMVVFTDVDLAANQFIRNPGNEDIIRNAINWLAKKEYQLGIAGKPPELRVASFSPNQMKIIFWLSTGGIPIISIISGSIMWWKRRR